MKLVKNDKGYSVKDNNIVIIEADSREELESLIYDIKQALKGYVYNEKGEILHDE